LLHLLWILPLLLLIFFLSSPRFRGDIAETRVRRILATGLERNLFTVFNDVVLPTGGGTTRIDHVVVSRYGIFVIHSVYVRGWISGTKVEERWRQTSIGRSSRFDNPLHRSQLQVEALQRLTGYPGSVFHALVVLVGLKGFRKPPPEQVVTAENLLAQLRRKAQPLLSPEQAEQATRAIEAGRIDRSGSRLARPVSLVRLLLLLLLLAGAWWVFAGDVRRLITEWQQNSERQSAAEQFHPDGSRKTERELWEDALVCAYSPDTGRCACYEPGGSRVDIDAARCRSLAERGSVLER
jgi:restriction system protein